MSEHPELASEQGYFDRVFEIRERKRDWWQNEHAYDAVAYPKLGHDFKEEVDDVLASMGDVDEPVAFGRLDERGGDRFYIGRRAITDDDHEPLVISWKASAAAKYYQATPTEPLGVVLKRTFLTEANSIVDIVDRLLAEAAPEMLSVPNDLLLRKLEKHRDGRLRDIVETIERAQDEVMRADADQLLVIQGGPGTGKTIIGLQRIAVMRYEHSEIHAEKVLFVGPSPAFIDYVGHVLPELGNERVAHRSIGQLSRLAVRQPVLEPTDRHRVKGDARMVQVMQRLVRERHRPPTDDEELRVDERRVKLTQAELEDLVRQEEGSGRPHNPGREQIRRGMARLAADKLGLSGVSTEREDLRANHDLMNLLDRMWPTVTPRQLLRDFFASERLLHELGAGLFSDDELAVLFRPQQQRLDLEPWSLADLALADELDELIRGADGRSEYEVVVVDEAQDLSPMELRMIARRCSSGRVTVLGDLAQATSPAAVGDWDEIAQHLMPDGQPNVVELKYGYRVPAEVMAVARAAANFTRLSDLVPAPVRETGEDPVFLWVDRPRLYRTAVETVREHLGKGASVGLIVAEGQFDEMANALDYEGILWTDGRKSLASGLVLIPAESSKGLEFDVVVVIEPALIAGSDPTGPNLLYVALTRTTRSLVVVYSEPLPSYLVDFGQTLRSDVESEPSVSSELPSESTDTRLAASEESSAVSPDRVSSQQSDDADAVRRRIIRVAADHLEAIIRGELAESQWRGLLDELKRRLGL